MDDFVVQYKRYTKGIQNAVGYSHYLPVYNPPSNPLIFMHTHL